MEKKRKLPARLASARVENVSKKRTSTPPEPQALQPPQLPTPVVEERLPKVIVVGQPLPTVDEPQPEDLPAKEYQSISESGVLAESLHRSRQKWLTEGIFEKYWTKPRKGKGAKAPVIEEPNNPARESMTKLGSCTITVEPHIFDATMFAIKEPHIRPLPQPLPQQPMYRPIIQYGPPNGIMPQQTQAPPAQKKQFQSAQPVPQAPAQSHDAPLKTSAIPAPSNIPTSGPPVSNGVLPNVVHTNGMPPNGQVLPNSTPNTQEHASAIPNNTTPSPAPATKSTDPVIQALAERAATDSDLKALMRIVANGEASTDELKKFQSHIDELTRLLKSRPAAAQPTPPSQGHPPPPPTTMQINGRQVSNPAPSVRTAQPPLAPTGRPENHLQPQPQALRSKGPLPPSKPDISGIVFEFAGGSGDRFLFPKYSILEYLTGGQVIASFLIVRKGSSSDSKTYDPLLDYYQPITIRLYTHQGRQLDSLAKVVAPPDEVRRYMDDIMDNMTRAEYVLLAMRLPREIDQAPTPAEKEDETANTAQLDNQVLWTSPNPIPVTKLKPVQKLITEEEKYQSFITSVS
jgi:hypothetical protein